MKYFGTVKSFTASRATAKSSRSWCNDRLEKSGLGQECCAQPGQRLSYDVGTGTDRQPRAESDDHLIDRRGLCFRPIL